MICFPSMWLFGWLRSVGELQSHDAGKYRSGAGKPGAADGFAIKHETKQKRPGSTDPCTLLRIDQRQVHARLPFGAIARVNGVVVDARSCGHRLATDFEHTSNIAAHWDGPAIT